MLALQLGCTPPEERAAAYLQEAQLLYEAGDLVHAKLDLRNALQIEPKNAQARYLLALIHEVEEDYAKALANLIMAVEADPGLVDARVKLGYYYAMGKQAEQAQEQADAAMRLAPDNADVRLLNARAIYLAGDAAEALNQANIALRIDPANPEAVSFAAALHIAAGNMPEALAVVDEGIGKAQGADVETLRVARVRILRQIGDTEAVERELLRLAEDFPDTASYSLDLARLYAEQGRVQEAEAQVVELIARDPDNASWRIELARLLLALDKVEDAESSLKQAITDDPDSDRLRLALAGFYEINDRRAEALEVYRAIAESSPASPDGLAARNRMASLYVGVDDRQSREIINAILREVPDNVDALLARAAFAISDNKLGEAIADLRSATVKQPDSQRGRLMLARAYLLNGDIELAEDAYRKLVALNPANRAARNELASLLGNRGDVDQAAELLRESLVMAPGDIGASRNLVKALLIEQDFAGAASEARRMAELGEPTGTADFQLGVALAAQGDTDGAIAAYRKALDKNPAADQALANLIRLQVDSGQVAAAEGYLLQHVDSYPDSDMARLLLGEIYRVDGRLEQAREVFTELIELDPRAIGAYIGLAGTHTAGSDAQLAAFARGLENNPGNSQLGLALGSAYKERGEHERAIDVYEDIVRINGGDDVIVTNLAALLLDFRTDSESFARALELASRFESQTSHPFNVAVLGWAYYRNGQSELAVRHLERAVAAVGENPKLRYYLGMAYLANGNEFGARQELQKAVAMTDAAAGWFDGYDDAVAALATLGGGPS